MLPNELNDQNDLKMLSIRLLNILNLINYLHNQVLAHLVVIIHVLLLVYFVYNKDTNLYFRGNNSAQNAVVHIADQKNANIYCDFGS